VLYNFCSQSNCSDGEYSSAALVSDGAGNLYGTSDGGSPGGGTVFELSPDGDGSWNETVLYNFCLAVVGCTDGSGPTNVILDRAGNLYGTTTDGGAYGYGAVFELSLVGANWTEKVLHSFAAGGDGAYPSAGVIMDSAGNLYGTNIEVVYELSPAGGDWTEQTIYNVGSYAPLTIDSAGNIFGVTSGPSAHTVFELSPNGKGGWNPAILHTFCGIPKDGCSPKGPLVFDGAGNIYGTTTSGGVKNLGTVYKLSPVTEGKNKGTWTEKILYTFQGGKNAEYPEAGIVFDAAGNIYGTTEHGGKDDAVYEGAGTIYELVAPKYTEKVLWSFDVADGYQPVGSLILDGEGNLYGTTWVGGSSGSCPDGCGVVFEVKPGFTMALKPGSASVAPGSPATSTVTVSAAGYFVGAVNLTCTVPGGDGLSCNLSPNSVTFNGTGSQTATLTVDTSSTTPAATYTITVKGNSGSLTQSAKFKLTVQ
jgi:uncharacterized repeat protein (TIGR03803 family)